MTKYMTNTERLNAPHGIERTKTKLAIVGCGNTYDHVERLMNDIDLYEIWGLNQLYVKYPRIVQFATRWFQIHHEDIFLEGDHRTFDWMNEELPFPVYVQEQYVDDFPCSVPFPKHELVERFGTYWGSQVAWMLGLAIYEGFEEIHLYGVHMALEDEWTMQKEGCEYYIGMARGLGIKVFIPPVCELLKTPFMYGFENPSHLFHKITLQVGDLERKKAEAEVRRNKNRDERNKIWGGIHLDYNTDEKKKQAEKDVMDLVRKDFLIKQEYDQIKGSLATYEYLKKNWISKWYTGRGENGFKTKATVANSDGGNESSINNG